MDRTTLARWLAWTSCVLLSLAAYGAIASIWLPVMSVAVVLASLGLATMVAALVVLVVDRRGPRRGGGAPAGRPASGS